MTRQKKTRSAGPNGLRHLSAEDARKTREPKEETKKKGSGLKSGNRNNVAAIKTEAVKESGKKDKRIGSKTPVSLTPQAEKPQQPPVLLQPKASLAKAKAAELTPQQLLERVEQNEILTGKDAKYFNAKTARLEQLMDMLGLGVDTDDAEIDPLAAFESKDWRKDLLGDED